MKKETRKEIIRWTVTIGLMLILWVTGWYRPVISKIQQGILLTGIIQPNTKEAHSDDAIEAYFIDENENPVSLSDFRGQVVFLNIWATWCPPCRAEMPGIQSLYDEVNKEDVAFVMLTTDREFAKAVQFKKDNGFTFPIYRLEQNLPAELSTSSIPATFVFDKEGAIQMTHEGMAKYNTAKFKEFLNSLNLAS